MDERAVREKIVTSPLRTTGSVDGFTLLEMLIALAILSLATAFGGLALPGMRQRAELRQATTRVDALLKEARAAALYSGVTTIIRFDANTNKLTLPLQEKAYVLPQSVTFTVTGARSGTRSDQPKILFLGDGSSSGGVIELRSGALGVVRRIGWLTGRIDRGSPE